MGCGNSSAGSTSGGGPAEAAKDVADEPSPDEKRRDYRWSLRGSCLPTWPLLRAASRSPYTKINQNMANQQCPYRRNGLIGEARSIGSSMRRSLTF
ncbi:hypothetical protein SKAU_G00035860 [Synaphobranchus kaupii]|uniref:Uncharacterized protein n=1 Tax=Synaphobranchus kaupii TaxID=118154 RepID=A0A9Q1GFS6_SYNKA|nr:hypothetical protein SKAU_G00035860 [Synaphobranchus kaupii]